MCNSLCTLTKHDRNCKGKNCAECWINYCIFDEDICPIQLAMEQERINASIRNKKRI